MLEAKKEAYGQNKYHEGGSVINRIRIIRCVE